MKARPATNADDAAIGEIIAPLIAAGEVFALPQEWSAAEALAYWCAPGKSTFVVEDGGAIVGTYYIQPNQLGRGGHVANAGYATRQGCEGRGIAAFMCARSKEEARRQGYRAMQFNFVVATNARAVALWRRQGFAIVGTVPRAFDHPRLGLVDAYVMHADL